MKQIARSKVTK